MTTTAARVRRRLGDLALTVGALVGGVFVLLAVAVAALDVRVLSFRSGSMSPTIDTGALALARQVPAADLESGDVVSVRAASGSRVTHRIVGIEHRGAQAVLQLRGDANQVADAEPYVVSEADRVVVAVPYLGYAGAAASSPVGIFVLGLYAAFLVRILVRGRTGKPRSPRTPRNAGKRRAPKRPAPKRRAGDAVVIAAVLALAVAGATVAQRTTSTLAAWTDEVGTSAAALSTGSVAKPATFTCGLLGFFSVSFSWSAVPGATSYTLHYGTNGSQTASYTGTSATITAAITGGTAWVTAEKNYGSTTWTSAASTTRNYSVIAISLCA